MDIRITFLAASCALALAACGDKSSDPANTSTPAQTDTSTPVPDPMQATGPTATGSDKPAAVVGDCAISIEGSDAMKFNVGSITVPASCSEFTINLKHTGQMPVAAMGHNVVISTAADMKGVAAEGMGAGIDAAYVKTDDARVIAHSGMIGGGGSTSVTFPVSRITAGGPYQFFCSFPGHSGMMKGSIAVE